MEDELSDSFDSTKIINVSHIVKNYMTIFAAFVLQVNGNLDKPVDVLCWTRLAYRIGGDLPDTRLEGGLGWQY